MTTRTVETVMTRDVVTARTETPFKELVDLLATRRIGALPVLDGERVVGVVSQTDLLHKLDLPENGLGMRLFGRGRRARDKAAGDVAGDLMTAPAVTVTPATTLAAAARLMARRRVTHLPVLDDADRLVGIVARHDLLSPYLRPDGELRDEISREVVERSLLLGPTDVTVAVDDGVVTLHGTVDRRSTALIAVRLTRGFAGVVDVVDELRWKYDDEEEIRRRYGFDAQVGPTVRL
jgi:CBS domain-containing protein